MDRSIILVVLTTLVGSVVLSGCTAQALPQSTAQEVQPPAEEAAHAWTKDARLVAIAGIEGRWSGGVEASGSYTGWHGHEDAAAADERVADGRCEIWVFRYVSSSKDLAYEVVVDRDGNVLGSDTDEREPDDQPIGLYNVNSDQAADKARKANQGIRDAEAHPDGGSVIALDRDDDYDNPVWVVVAGAPGKDGWTGGIVVIDAITGEVLADFDMSDWGGYGPYGSGSYGGYDSYGGTGSYGGYGS